MRRRSNGLPIARLPRKGDFGRATLAFRQRVMRRATPLLTTPSRSARKLSEVALAAVLAQHAMQMMAEHDMPDIDGLIGENALTLRLTLSAQYARMLERLTA